MYATAYENVYQMVYLKHYLENDSLEERSCIKLILKDIQEMKTEIVFKLVHMIHFHQAVQQDIQQMAMETASHLNQQLLVQADILEMKMQFVNLSTKKIHLLKLYVRLELIVTEQETVLRTLFQLFVIQIIIVMEMATAYQTQFLHQAFAHMVIYPMVMEIVSQ